MTDSLDDRGEELLGYFFPRRPPRDRVGSALRRAGEVLLVLLLVAVATLTLRQVWNWMDAAWCSWRLDVMTSRPLDGEAVAEDLAVASTAMAEHHPLLRTADVASGWRHRIENVQESMVEGGSAWDLLRALGPAVAAVGCGHTSLLPPEGWINLMARGGRVLPMEVRFFGDRAHVTAHFADGVSVPVGAEVVTIDGRPVAEVWSQLVRAAPADGPGTVYAEAMVDQAFFFHLARFGGNVGEHRLQWRTATTDALQETVVPSRNGGLVGERYWRRFPERHPRHPPFPIHGAVMPESGVAYLWIPTFSLERAQGWRAHLHRFFDEVEEAGAHTLVLDVRANAGGPSPLAVELVEHLVTEPFVFLRDPAEPQFAGLPVFRHFARVIMPHSDTTFRGELFVLVDGGSFSTTGHLCAVLRQHRRVHFVGESSGGGATCYDNPVTVELPNSGLRLRVARTTFAVAADGNPIRPDLRLQQELGDVLAGRDSVLAVLGEDLGADLEGARAGLADALTVIPRH